MAAGWQRHGLGRVERAGTTATGTGGIQVHSDVVTYRAEEQRTDAQPYEFTTAGMWVYVSESTYLGMSSRSSEATVSVTGHYADRWSSEHPPVMANVQLWCSEQSGNWGTGDDEVELLMGASVSTVAGTPEEPALVFACRVELKVPSAKNVILTFNLAVAPEGQLTTSNQQFEYGRCDLTPIASSGGISLAYRSWDHG